MNKRIICLLLAFLIVVSFSFKPIQEAKAFAFTGYVAFNCFLLALSAFGCYKLVENTIGLEMAFENFKFYCDFHKDLSFETLILDLTKGIMLLPDKLIQFNLKFLKPLFTDWLAYEDITVIEAEITDPPSIDFGNANLESNVIDGDSKNEWLDFYNTDPPECDITVRFDHFTWSVADSIPNLKYFVFTEDGISIRTFDERVYHIIDLEDCKLLVGEKDLLLIDTTKVLNGAFFGDLLEDGALSYGMDYKCRVSFQRTATACHVWFAKFLFDSTSSYMGLMDAEVGSLGYGPFIGEDLALVEEIYDTVSVPVTDGFKDRVIGKPITKDTVLAGLDDEVLDRTVLGTKASTFPQTRLEEKDGVITDVIVKDMTITGDVATTADIAEVKGILGTLTVAVDKVGNLVSDTIDGVVGWIKALFDFLTDILHRILQALKDIYNVIMGLSITKILEAIKAIPKTIGQTITDVWTKAFEVPADAEIKFDKLKIGEIKEVFPFCIPFDFLNAIKVFSASASDPNFEISMDTNYFSVDHTIDLSPFTLYFGFLRYTFVAWFTVFLILKTRDLIKW